MNANHSMTGRSIFITGGASGIGRATALQCARLGAAVTIADLQEDAGNALVEDIEALGGRALFIALDVTSDEQQHAAVARCEQIFGHVDGACNAAGLTFGGTHLHEMPLANWEKVEAVNSRGLFLSMKYELQAMLRHGSGSIVNVASAAAVMGIPFGGEYCATKGGVAALTRSAAIEYSRRLIRVNAVLPGAIATPLLDAGETAVPGLIDAARNANPMGRLGTVDEVAFAITWLLSTEASFVTGVSLPVDGGITAA